MWRVYTKKRWVEAIDYVALGVVMTAAYQWRRVVLSLATLCWMPALGWSAPVVLTLVPEARVQGPRVTLEDVADVQGEDAAVVARLQEVLLGQAPPTGVERRLSRNSIITQLKHQGFTTQPLELKGATQVRITRDVQRLEPEAMEAAVQQAFSRRLPQTTRYTIRDIRGLHTVVVPPGPVQYEVVVPGQHTVLGPNSFRLVIAVNGKMAKQLHGTAYVAMTEEVVSLTRPVAKDDIITADAVTLSQIEVTQPLQQPITRLEEAIGKRARRSLSSHTPLSTQDVVAALVVQRGDPVTIVLESSVLKVSTPGEALEAGKLGETIRVRNIASKREVRAQVIDKHTVRVPL